MTAARPPVAVIAGATRGIGLALVAALARDWRDRLGPQARVYLTARGSGDGADRAAHLQAQGLNVDWLPFDQSTDDGARGLAELLRERHGGVDIAVLNGAYAPRDDEPAARQARITISTNNHGSLRFLQAFAPLMRENGRLVIVASGFGTLANLPEPLRPLFDTRVRSADEIDATMDDYVAAAEASTAAAAGWPDWVNIPSKVGQVAVMRAYARATRDRLAPGVLIDAACPGLTLTEATRDLMNTVFKGRPAQTVEQAAAGLMTLLGTPPGAHEPYGELVRHGKVIPYGD